MNKYVLTTNTHTKEAWASFSNKKITKMDTDAMEFWETFGAMLLSILEVV